MRSDKRKETKFLLDEDQDTAEIKERPTPGCYIKRRYIMIFMGFLATFNFNSLKTNLSVAIVVMVNTTKKARNESNTCPGQNSTNMSGRNIDGVFDWNSVDQGLLLSCYFYGYIFTSVPGACLSKRYGFKLVLGVCVIVSSILTLCTPAAAYSSFELVVALRILLGVFQVLIATDFVVNPSWFYSIMMDIQLVGVTYPSLMHSWSQWAPPLERSVLVGIASSGTNFGACVTFPLAGFVADLLGWEAVFYYTGGVSLVFSIVWFAIIDDTPNANQRISDEEKVYITESIGLEVIEENTTPWKSMLTSLPVLAIISGDFSATWGNYTLQMMLPTYLSSILNFNITTSGALSALPYILRGISFTLGGFVTDIIRKRGIVSTIVIRKINTTLALAVPAILVIIAGYIGCNASAVVALLAFSLGFNGLIAPGCITNTLDIAPKYGGIILGLSKTIEGLCGILTPQVTGFILLKGNNIYQWRVVFWLSAAIYLFGAVVYIILGSGVEQEWARRKVTTNDIYEEHSDDDAHLPLNYQLTSQ